MTKIIPIMFCDQNQRRELLKNECVVIPIPGYSSAYKIFGDEIYLQKLYSDLMLNLWDDFTLTTKYCRLMLKYSRPEDICEMIKYLATPELIKAVEEYWPNIVIDQQLAKEFLKRELDKISGLQINSFVFRQINSTSKKECTNSDVDDIISPQ